MRRANSSVRSPSSSCREDLAHHAEAVGLLDVDRVAGEHELLGLARAELPRVREVLDAAHAEAGAHDVGEDRALGRDDEVARPHQHEAGGVHAAVHLGDGDLAQVPPPQRVLEEVVPLLQHQALGALAGAAVGRLRSGAGARPAAPPTSPCCRCRGPTRTSGRCRRRSPPARCRRPRPAGRPRSSSTSIDRCCAFRVSGRSSMIRAIVPSSSVS